MFSPEFIPCFLLLLPSSAMLQWMPFTTMLIYLAQQTASPGDRRARSGHHDYLPQAHVRREGECADSARLSNGNGLARSRYGRH
jgi:hypothetical protein